MVEYKQLNRGREICRDVEGGIKEQIVQCRELPEGKMRNTFLRIRSEQLEEIISIREQLQNILTAMSGGSI